MENAYKEFLVKLEDAKSSVREDESLRTILEDSENVYKKLKEAKDVDLYNKIMPGLSIATILICLIHILIHGFWSGLAGILLMVVFIFISRVSLNRRIQDVNRIRSETEFSKLIKKEELSSFMDYVFAGIELKKFRFKLLLVSFGVILPFVLISLSEILIGKQGLMAIILAFLICSSFAWIIFQKDLSQLTKMEDEIEQLETLL